MPTTRPPISDVSTSSEVPPISEVPQPVGSRARHRTPGRARIGGPQLPERVCLAIAVACSVAAVLLSVSGHRVPAISVAALGLVLAVTGLVLGWRSASRGRDRLERDDLRRGSGSPAR